MYDSNLAQLSYAQLFKVRGKAAALQSLILVSGWAIFNTYVLGQLFTPSLALLGFIFFAGYFTWKPKLISFLRGK